MALTKIRKGNIEPNVQLPHANAAFDAANSSSSYANSAFAAANNAVDTWVRDAANSASDYANSAYTAANNAVDTWVRDAANSASDYANSSFDVANSSADYANSAFVAANNATDSWVRDAANSSSSYANSAFEAANNAGISVVYDNFVGDDSTTQFELSATPINENYTLISLNGVIQHKSSYNVSAANVIFSEAPVTGEKIDVVTFLNSSESEATAGSYANSAYGQANTATTNAATADLKAISAGAYANAAFAVANTAGGSDDWARDSANSAGSYANSAYTEANNKLDLTGGTVTGNITLGGDFLPDGDETRNLGSPTLKWKELYLSGNTIILGNASIFTDVTSGSIGLIPAPTTEDPNPVALVINRSGSINRATTTNGRINAASLAAARNAETSSSSSYANGAFEQANIATTSAITSGTYANAAFAVANTAGGSDDWARDAANSASSYANSAYTEANNKLDLTGGTLTGNLVVTGNIVPSSDNVHFLGSETERWHSLYVGDGSIYIGDLVLSNDANKLAVTDSIGNRVTISSNNIVLGDFVLSSTGAITGDVIITGNLSVTGTLADLQVNGLVIDDNIIDINEATLGSPTLNAGLRVKRGDENSVLLRWNETTDHWEFTNDGASYSNIASDVVGVYANAAFAVANNATDSWVRDAANSASSYANSGYSQSNTATANALTADQKAVSAGTYANAAFAVANTAGGSDDWARDSANSAGSYANSAYDQANTATTNATQADQRAVTSGDYANSAFSIANNSITSTLSSTLNAADNIINRPVLEDYGIKGVSIGNTGGATTINLESGNFFTATLSQACTFTFSNPIASGNFCGFSLALTNGGAYNVTWPASVDWQGGTAPTLTTSGLDMLAFVTYNGGTSWIGLVSGLDIK